MRWNEGFDALDVVDDVTSYGNVRQALPV